MSWISGHLFHRGDLDRLVTHVVGPLVAELTANGDLDGYFFLRYWEGGPHLRLRLRPCNPDRAGQVRAAVLDHGARYLGQHPSPPAQATYTEAAYRAMAAWMARAERMPEHDVQLYPDDSMRFIPYRPEHASYGHGVALAAVERHFTESSELALALLTAGSPPALRHAVAVGALMLTLAVCEPDVDRIADRLGEASAGAASTSAPAEFEHSYAQHREALRAQASDLWAGAPVTGPLAGWLDTIRALHTQLTDAHQCGQFAPTDAASPLSGLTRAAGPHTPAVTRVLLRCTHLLCNRLGIHSRAETHLVSLVVRTMTELHAATEVATP